MLYLIYGKDSFQAKQKLSELLDFFKIKSGSSGFFRISTDNFKENDFDELLKSNNLFNEKNIIICDYLSDGKSVFNFVSKKLKQCANSENIFIFLEGELDEKVLKLFEKETKKIEECKLLVGVKLKKWVNDELLKQEVKVDSTLADKLIKECGSDLWCISKEIERYVLSGEGPSVTNIEEYNPFAICDAIARKNKTQSWMMFQNALMLGVPAEEVFWKVVWQVKNLLLVKNLAKDPKINIPKESGLHPYVVKKTLSVVSNFTDDELKKYSLELIKIYHNTRRGLTDFSTDLEKFLITL